MMTKHEARLHNKQVRETSGKEHFNMTNNEFEPNNSGVYLALAVVVLAIAGIFYLLTN